MKNILICIGESFSLNDAFMEYVKREAKKAIISLHATILLREKDKDMFLSISKAYEEYDNLLIVATYQSYPTVSKVIATIFEDNLVAKEEMVVPSKAKEVIANSYLMVSERKAINVLRASACTKLPKILLHVDMDKTNLFIFEKSKKEIVEVMEPLAKSYEIGYALTQETPGLYKMCAYNKKFGDLAMFVQNAKLHFPHHLVVAQNIFEYMIERLSSLHKTITFAESCTGGLLASLLTKIPGSSNIFHGSLVTYANEIKHAWLGVKNETLESFGAVSEETVEEMLAGALRVSSANYAIAISGIAGPGGATPTKPVGTVVVGASDGENTLIRTMHFQGDRNYIQYQAAMYGVELLFIIARDELF